jgi:hypothetical protein
MCFDPELGDRRSGASQARAGDRQSGLGYGYTKSWGELVATNPPQLKTSPEAEKHFYSIFKPLSICCPEKALCRCESYKNVLSDMTDFSLKNSVPASKSVQNSNKVGFPSLARSLPTACKFCQSENLEIGKGAGPHIAQLKCADCNRHIQWISKSLAAELGISGGVA